jgi:biopolymer transport protein ExbD
MPLKTTQDELPAMNLTSMVDVLLLMLIFFMVGTQFVDDERNIDLQVPEVSEAGALSSAPEKRVVNVDRAGRITLERNEVTLDELTRRLAAARGEYSELGVIVRGDGAVDLQSVANVLSACREAGISDMGISVRVADRRNK